MLFALILFSSNFINQNLRTKINNVNEVMKYHILQLISNLVQPNFSLHRVRYNYGNICARCIFYIPCIFYVINMKCVKQVCDVLKNSPDFCKVPCIIAICIIIKCIIYVNAIIYYLQYRIDPLNFTIKALMQMNVKKIYFVHLIIQRVGVFITLIYLTHANFS